jgi:DNA-binding NtrC family response regulator
MTVPILMVEDDHDQAALFSQVLQMSGYAVEDVASAEEAQARLAAQSFALLLADWDLGGGMKGDALILWAKAQCPGIKTILFSNHSQVVGIAATCGADAAFRKIDGVVKFRQLVATLVPLGADHT